jgi:hypothetical protein
MFSCTLAAQWLATPEPHLKSSKSASNSFVSILRHWPMASSNYVAAAQDGIRRYNRDHRDPRGESYADISMV